MPKWINTLAADALLDYIAGATAMHACSTLDASPTLAEVTTASLADVALAGGDFTKATGDAGGQSRKTIIAAKPGVTIDFSGTADHIALVDGSVVRLVTTCTSQALAAAGTVNFPAWEHEVGGN
jgi:hypothetical protein